MFLRLHLEEHLVKLLTIRHQACVVRWVLKLAASWKDWWLNSRIETSTVSKSLSKVQLTCSESTVRCVDCLLLKNSIDHIVSIHHEALIDWLRNSNLSVLLLSHELSINLWGMVFVCPISLHGRLLGEAWILTVVSLFKTGRLRSWLVWLIAWLFWVLTSFPGKLLRSASNILHCYSKI